MARQERAERTREAIIHAAARVFEREGYEAAPLADITRSATVTKGALYFHFPSKRDLAYAVVSQARGSLDALIGPLLARRGGTELPVQLLIDLSHVVLLRLAADPVLRAGLSLGADPALFPDPGSGLAIDWPGLIEQLATGGPDDPPDWPRPLGSLLTGLELVFRKYPEHYDQALLSSVWRLMLPGVVPADEAGLYEPAGRIAPAPDRDTSPPAADAVSDMTDAVSEKTDVASETAEAGGAVVQGDVTRGADMSAGTDQGRALLPAQTREERESAERGRGTAGGADRHPPNTTLRGPDVSDRDARRR
ncbi:MAG TPA: TetR family transcriptional regulator [Actinocrinis sp.]|uniref:TetR family transcriptional regulator n=1 Tax=Actinocrinis sp. TaxID=1920516 RepID=UPI002DDC9F33|nr:TetR family transcriptional regulator [Actinocrinis sp.]HEV3172557.1 TetR family transcriptional regulator [Actinocrinis sp.]